MRTVLQGSAVGSSKFIKKGYLFQIALSSLFILLFTTCTKTIHDRRSRATVTPESREYFGCRVNGSGFVTEARNNNVSGSCSYVSSYRNTAKTFQIFSNRFHNSCKNSTVGITLDSVELVAGKRYNLGIPGAKANYGTYFLVPDCGQDRIEMNTFGETNNYIIIKSFDPIKKVVTGTFNFTVRDAQGNRYQITDGIFDRHFTTD